MLLAMLGLATLAATPSTLPRVIQQSRGGDTVILTGTFQAVEMLNRRYRPRLNIDARRATIAGVTFNGTNGVNWTGGTITAGPRGYSMHIKNSSNISVEGGVFTAAVRGIVVDRSTDLDIRKNLFSKLRVDGIDIVGQRIRVDDNECRDFTPIKGDHPDCVQGWSVLIPTSDITVTGNRALGTMQGFFFRSDLPGAPGLSNIVIQNNYAKIRYSNGFMVAGGTNTRIRWNYGTKDSDWVGKVNARLKGTGVMCGNKLPDVGRSPAALPC